MEKKKAITEVRVTQQDVDNAVDYVLKTVQYIKAHTYRPQHGTNFRRIFESFPATADYSFELTQNDRLQFNKKAPDIPFYCVSELGSIPISSDEEEGSKITTTVTPYARAWINSEEQQAYIQVMGLIKFSWDLHFDYIPSTEPLGVSVKVYPKSGMCSLDQASLPPNQILSTREKAELTETHKRDKGISADTSIQVGVNATGGTITLPSVRPEYNVSDQTELKRSGIEVNKNEFERSYQSSALKLIWAMERKCSRTRSIDGLTLYNSKKVLSPEEFEMIKLEDRNEPFSDYVNFGVWKWDGKEVSFVFDVHHRYRCLTPKRIHGRSKYESHQENTFAGRHEFTVRSYTSSNP